MAGPDDLSVVDLFCGAGGLSLGLKMAGCGGVLSIDNWDAAVKTYVQNIGNHARCQNVSPDVDLPTCDLIAGGPPCQGFSSAGRREADDERNSLVRVYATVIARHRPTAFIFENVEGFLTAGNGQYVADLLEPLIDAGYWIHLRKINAANYGVPQHRKRVIALGGLGFDPGFPEPTHRAFGAPGADLAAANRPMCPTLADALAGLPPATTTPHSEIKDHVSTWLSESDLERAMRLGPGQTMRDLPEHLWHPSYIKRANRRVADGMPTEKRGGAPAGVRRLVADEPCKAITGGALRDFLHPTEHRPLTIRECARVQTYPDWFVFEGSQSDRMQMIGNGVPVRLGEALGRHLAQRLKTAKTDALAGGRLLSFVPTLSNGRSPALDATCRLIEARFTGGFLPGLKEVACR